jgi:hypothetical protein
MFKKFAIAIIVGSLVVGGVGCAKKTDTSQSGQSATQSQLPAGHPSPTNSGQPAKPVNVQEVSDKVTKAIDAKFAGDWSVSGTTLKKGDYAENNNYKIADEVANLYPGSMVSIFVGQNRISGTVKDQTGNRVLAGYATPETVGEVMKSGKATVTSGGTMGSSSYQKVYMPFKSKDGKTVAVMSISLVQ